MLMLAVRVPLAVGEKRIERVMVPAVPIAIGNAGTPVTTKSPALGPLMKAELTRSWPSPVLVPVSTDTALPPMGVLGKTRGTGLRTRCAGPLAGLQLPATQSVLAGQT